MGPGEARLVTERSGSTEIKQRETVYNTSWWTVVVSTKRALLYYSDFPLRSALKPRVKIIIHM